MTAIAYRDGIVAADSRTSSNEWINPFPSQKLFRDSDRTVWAHAGDVASCVALRKWIAEPNGPQPNGDCTVVRFRDGIITTFSQGGSYDDSACEWQAWGSGTPVAHAAMHAGCSAEEAVRISCKVDPWSGEPITSMRVWENPMGEPAPDDRRKQERAA